MPAAPARRRGRPRDPRSGDAILSATLEALATDGYDGLTMERVANDAGVSKATIYRRWATKDDVVVAAVERLAQEVPVPEAGSLRGDLEAIAAGLVAVFSAPRTARLVATLLARAAVDPTLAEALRGGFLAARREAAVTALERARARGEIGADLDPEIAVDLFAAPFYYRLLVTGEPIDDDYAGVVVDAVVRWASH